MRRLRRRERARKRECCPTCGVEVLFWDGWAPNPVMVRLKPCGHWAYADPDGRQFWPGPARAMSEQPHEVCCEVCYVKGQEAAAVMLRHLAWQLDGKPPGNGPHTDEQAYDEGHPG